MSSVTFVVEIEPQAALRTRSAGKVHYTPKKYKDWMDDFDILARAAFNRTGFPAIVSKDVPVKVDVIAHFSIPESRKKGKNRVLQGDYHIQKPDRDNVLKAVLDGIVRIGIVPDDAQICDGRTSKLWADEGSIFIKLTIL